MKWGWYSDTNTFRVFMHLLLTASYEDNEFNGHHIKAGQTVFGRKQLATALKLSERQVRTALEHLKATNEITIETTNRFSIATIENWGKYQFGEDKTDQQSDQQEATQPTNNRPTTDHTQEIKNIRNKEIYKEVPEDILPAFLEWAQMRKQMKRPLVSKRAVKMAINKLNKLANTTEKKIEIIEYAIYRNWLSFYEIPKEDRKMTIDYYHEEERKIDDPADDEYVQAIKDKIAGFVKGVE